jgi:hypothetical protein
MAVLVRFGSRYLASVSGNSRMLSWDLALVTPTIFCHFGNGFRRNNYHGL